MLDWNKKESSQGTVVRGHFQVRVCNMGAEISYSPWTTRVGGAGSSTLPRRIDCIIRKRETSLRVFANKRQESAVAGRVATVTEWARRLDVYAEFNVVFRVFPRAADAFGARKRMKSRVRAAADLIAVTSQRRSFCWTCQRPLLRAKKKPSTLSAFCRPQRLFHLLPAGFTRWTGQFGVSQVFRLLSPDCGSGSRVTRGWARGRLTVSHGTTRRELDSPKGKNKRDYLVASKRIKGRVTRYVSCTYLVRYS